MKKKIFNATIGGYYVVSIILGIAIALTVGMMVMDAWDYALDIGRSKDSLATLKGGLAWDEFLDEAWLYLPMTGLYGMLYGGEYSDTGRYLYGYNYAPVVLMVSAVVVVFLSVMIMEGKSANKAWRQKMHQACGWGLLIILMDLAFWYARRRMYGSIPTGVVLVPVILLIIPFLVLKKTRIRKEGAEKQSGKIPKETIRVDGEETEVVHVGGGQ